MTHTAATANATLAAAAGFVGIITALTITTRVAAGATKETAAVVTGIITAGGSTTLVGATFTGAAVVITALAGATLSTGTVIYAQPAVETALAGSAIPVTRAINTPLARTTFSGTVATGCAFVWRAIALLTAAGRHPMTTTPAVRRTRGRRYGKAAGYREKNQQEESRSYSHCSSPFNWARRAFALSIEGWVR